MTLQQRIDNYHKATGFPRSLQIGGDGRINGVWVMGNSYKVASGLYGGYPHGYLRRIKALFPDLAPVSTLHLFSGQVDTTAIPGATVDINPDTLPDYVDDAQTLRKVPLEKFRFILADPPYSVEDAERYQTTMIKRNVVMRTLGERCRKGTFVIWLDQVLPVYKKEFWDVAGYIGMVKSTNHRFRVITIFQHK